MFTEQLGGGGRALKEMSDRGLAGQSLGSIDLIDEWHSVAASEVPGKLELEGDMGDSLLRVCRLRLMKSGLLERT